MSFFVLTFSKVFVRRRIPQRPLDDSMYYQFDYQKIYAWNLQYEQVAFLDAVWLKKKGKQTFVKKIPGYDDWKQSRINFPIVRKTFLLWRTRQRSVMILFFFFVCFPIQFFFSKQIWWIHEQRCVCGKSYARKRGRVVACMVEAVSSMETGVFEISTFFFP